MPMRKSGLAVDESGNVYLTDGSIGQIEVFGPNGQPPYRFGRRVEKAGQFDGLKDCGSKQDDTWRIPGIDVCRSFRLMGRPEVHASKDLLSRPLRFAGFVGRFFALHQAELFQFVS